MDRTGKREDAPEATGSAADAGAPDGTKAEGGPGAAEHLPTLNFLDEAKLIFEKPAPDRPVRLTIEGDRSYLRISARAAFPLTDRSSHIELYDGTDKSLGMIRSLDDLAPDARAIIAAELDRRYFTPVITGITRVKREFGFYRWEVSTDRGSREFMVRSIREDVEILDRGRYRIKDVDGRFYEIPDARRLPPLSRRTLEELL